MSISQYVIGGTALVAALAIGYAKWVDQGAKVDKAEARTAIVRAECATNTAVDTTEALNQQIADLTREVERQRIIAASAEKKSRQRLDAFNALNRKIGNVPNDENVPVPAPVELFFDELRRVVPGDGSSADSADENGNDRKADPSPSGMSEATTPTS